MVAGAQERGIIAATSDDGQCYAAFDVGVHHVQPSVAATRFSARLSPFATQDQALHALAAAGAIVDQAGSR